MKLRHAAAFIALSAALTACVSGSNSSSPTPFQAKFKPLDAIMPFPNDLYFNGSTSGQLNIPAGASTSTAAVAAEGPLLELNHLDGFGTQSNINIYFNAPVDASTLATNVHVYQVSSSVTTKAVDPGAPFGTGIAPAALKEGTDYSIGLSPGSDTNGENVVITPLHPLAPSSVNPITHVATPSTYLVVVTSGVKDTSGNAVTPSDDYASILAADLPVLSGGKMGSTGDKSLDQVALFTLPQLVDAAVAKVDPKSIVLTFSFSTEYLGVSLAEIGATATATAQPSGVGIIDTGETVCQALVAAKEIASASDCATEAPGSTATEVFAGTVALPYYLPVPTKADPTAALTGSWHNAQGGDTALNATNPNSFMPAPTVAQNVIPILAALPLAGGPCTMPGTGWPVVIFQHGITRNREDMLAMASGFGGSCVAVLAIDLPLHGVTNTSDPLYLKGHERTFDMDLQNNSTGAAGPDGKIDSSGAWFINLNSTITSRDNLREGAADLINLVATLPNLTAVTLPSTVYTFDHTQVHFVGHSLGGIVGTTFLGADTVAAQLTSSTPKVLTATLGMPGGHIAELLRNSPEFEPIIDQGLASNGIVKGTQFYYDFYSNAQAVVEDGDPANYAAFAAAGHPIHMIEVVGDGTAKNLPDQVVPNSATQVLADAMGLTTIKATTSNALGLHGLVQFTAGDHGSLLDPTASAAATAEMQTEMVVFAVGNPLVPLPGDGQVILISNTSVVKH